MIFTLSADCGHATLSYTTFEPTWLRKVEELSGLSVMGFCFALAPEGLFQRVVTEGEGVFCERTTELVAQGVPELGRPLIEQLVVILGIEKSIYAPLRVSGEMHGLLAVANTDLTEADVPAVTAFANQAGIAIENAQLLEQVSASRERLRRLARQIVSAQEEERQRLSRTLHDEAGQALTTLKISLELIGEDLPVEFSSLRQRISDAAALTTATLEQVRLLARGLRPPALDAVGLGPTLEGFCHDFAQCTGLSIDYLGLELPVLPDAVNTCLYRFLQEALTNVAKHACANRVYVALHHDAQTVSLSVEDDGRGFDKQARLSVSGWSVGIGLLGMQERLKSLGGRLEIESQPGHGTCLAAHIPTKGIPWEESR
jgi:signal transduction histidine kinase